MVDMPDWGRINPQVIATFRSNHGKVGGPFEGSPMLLLHTVGAHSGRIYINPLTYLLDSGRYVVFASNVGAEHHPGWFHNIIANSDVFVEVGDRTFRAEATVASGGERDQLYGQQVAAFPRFGEYQEKTVRKIPVVVLTPGD